MYINNRHKVTKDTKCSVLNVLTVNQDQQKLLSAGKRFLHLHTSPTHTLHLHTGLQVQWWLMMSTCVLTRLSIHCNVTSMLRSFFFFSYSRHCPLTQQVHKHRYSPLFSLSHCLVALYYKHLVAIIKRSFFFRPYWKNRNSRQDIKNTTWKSSACAGTCV